MFSYIFEKENKTEWNHALHFVPLKNLPKDSEVVWRLEGKLSSGEGPLVSEVNVEHRFNTYGPMKVVEDKSNLSGLEKFLFDSYSKYAMTCGSWTFTNPIHSTDYQSDFQKSTMVKCIPPLKDQRVSWYGSNLSLAGIPEPDTDYRITVFKGLKDNFGQITTQDYVITARSAAKGEKVPDKQTFRVKNAPKYKNMWIMDPFMTKPELQLESAFVPQVRVSVYAVDPSNFVDYNEYSNALHSYKQLKKKMENQEQKQEQDQVKPIRPTPPGKKIAEVILDIKEEEIVPERKQEKSESATASTDK